MTKELIGKSVHYIDGTYGNAVATALFSQKTTVDGIKKTTVEEVTQELIDKELIVVLDETVSPEESEKAYQRMKLAVVREKETVEYYEDCIAKLRGVTAS